MSQISIWASVSFKTIQNNITYLHIYAEFRLDWRESVVYCDICLFCAELRRGEVDDIRVNRGLGQESNPHISWEASLHPGAIERSQ